MLYKKVVVLLILIWVIVWCNGVDCFILWIIFKILLIVEEVKVLIGLVEIVFIWIFFGLSFAVK